MDSFRGFPSKQRGLSVASNLLTNGWPSVFKRDTLDSDTAVAFDLVGRHKDFLPSQKFGVQTVTQAFHGIGYQQGKIQTSR